MSEHHDKKRTDERFRRLMAGEGLSNSVLPSLTNEQSRKYIKYLQERLREAIKSRASEDDILENIIHLRDVEPKIPDWVLTPKKSTKKSPGAPTLFASDWHYGEVVRSEEVNGRNEYSIATANRRIRAFTGNAIDLLRNHVVNPSFPGITLALGGDMVSGDIHEELKITNEVAILPAVVELYGKLVWVIQTLADEFGKVFIPCVTGNHGRQSRKPQAKKRNETNYDWLTYALLKKHFEEDKRVDILLPGGSDAHYTVYGYRFLLTHGDQFRGGDGGAGVVAPIARGDARKRARNSEIDMAYDTILMGHWHQYMATHRFIVNGSLKGMDEYSYQGNFPYEPPRQALWLNHPDNGITISMPVLVDKDTKLVGGKTWRG